MTIRRTVSLPVLAVAAVALAGAGCASHQITGTWKGGSPSPGDFEVGGMTLADDGTYTAFANYDGKTRGFSGSWDMDGDDLVLDAGRRYSTDLDGDRLTLTDPRTRITSSLRRIK